MQDEHIAHSDIVKQIFYNNKKRVNQIIEKAHKIMKPMIDEAEKSEKGDICVQYMIYVRAGNDMLTSFYNTHRVQTTSTDHDSISFFADVERLRLGYLIKDDTINE